MSELLHREEQTQVLEVEQQEESQNKINIDEQVKILKEEQEQQILKEESIKIDNTQINYNNQGNPQEQEMQESELQAQEELKTEENEESNTLKNEQSSSSPLKQEIETTEQISQVLESQQLNQENVQIEEQPQQVLEIPSEKKELEQVVGEVPQEKQETQIEDVISEEKKENPEVIPVSEEIVDVKPSQEQKDSNTTETKEVVEEKKEETQTKSEPVYTVEKRLTLANQLKDQARDLIKEKRYSEALAIYQQALEITNPTYFQYINNEIKQQYVQLSSQLLNNLAFCYFHLGNYQISAQISDQTLIIDPKNLKAMYRRAVCYKNMGDYERAFEAIKTAVKSGGNESKEIYSEYEAIKAIYKEYLEQNKQREKEIYSRMMNNSSNKISETKRQEQENTLVEDEKQKLINSIFFFGSTAMSFLVASKVMKVDVTSKTGFSLTSSLAASIYASYHFGNKWMKGFFGICALALFGYLGRKSLTQ